MFVLCAALFLHITCLLAQESWMTRQYPHSDVTVPASVITITAAASCLCAVDLTWVDVTHLTSKSLASWTQCDVVKALAMMTYNDAL